MGSSRIEVGLDAPGGRWMAPVPLVDEVVENLTVPVDQVGLGVLVGAVTTRHLLAAGLISGAVEPGIVNLRDGVGTETVIQELVRARIPLSELCREHQTLEQFYLALMSEERRSLAGKSETVNVSPAST